MKSSSSDGSNASGRVDGSAVGLSGLFDWVVSDLTGEFDWAEWTM